MKKFLTLRNVIKFGAVVLGLVAFFFMFGNQLTATGKITGEPYVITYDKALFGDGGAVLSFVGYILMALGCAVTLTAVFAKGGEMTKKIIVYTAGGLLVLGAIFVFLEVAVYRGVSLDLYKISFRAMPIIAGVLGVVAGLAVVASEFVPDQQLVK